MERHEPPFLLTGIPVLQWLLTGPWWRVFLVLAIPGTVMVLLSIPFGVASIPATHATGLEQNLGLLYRANWTWPYVLVVPASLLLLRHLSWQIRSSVADLEEMGVLVQTERAAGRTFVQRLTDKLDGTALITVVVCVAATLVFLVFDTLDLIRGYYAYAGAGASGLCPHDFFEVDWAVAFAAGECWDSVQVVAQFDPPSLWRNAAFTVIAYSAQTLMLIAYLIWFARLTQFFFFLSSSLQGAEFEIVPMFDDPMRRLGLGPLGGIYNTFLTLILMFELYVAAHRVQQVALVNGLPIGAYLRDLLAVSSSPSQWLDASVHQFTTVDVGTGVLVVAVAAPITLICWFPLLQMRGYIRRRKLEFSKEFAVRRIKAKEEGDLEEVDRLARQVRQLDESNIWPNGDGVAQRFILGMAVIWLGAIFPIVFVGAALGAFGLLELIRFGVWAADRFGKSKSPDPA